MSCDCCDPEPRESDKEIFSRMLQEALGLGSLTNSWYRMNQRLDEREKDFLRNIEALKAAITKIDGMEQTVLKAARPIKGATATSVLMRLQEAEKEILKLRGAMVRLTGGHHAPGKRRAKK